MLLRIYGDGIQINSYSYNDYKSKPYHTKIKLVYALDDDDKYLFKYRQDNFKTISIADKEIIDLYKKNSFIYNHCNIISNVDTSTKRFHEYPIITWSGNVTAYMEINVFKPELLLFEQFSIKYTDDEIKVIQPRYDGKLFDELDFYSCYF